MPKSDCLKFFIVDDDPFSRMFYRQYLMNLGYSDNVMFDNGPDCIQKLSLQPDVIILDYDMSPMNGLEVMRRIKKTNPEIQFLMISAVDDRKLAGAVIANGAVDFILKGERDLELIRKVLGKIVSGGEAVHAVH